MGRIWLIMLISSICVMLFNNPSAAVEAMITGAEDAVALAMQLVAVYGIWLGFFSILEKLGISDKIAKLLSPLIRFLFKGADDEAQKYIAMNMSANLIGLGNAATPMGINAIKKLDDGKEKANANMIMMIVISATSLQLLPSTVIGMRASHGSANVGDFLLPCVVATVCSTLLGIILAKLCERIFLKDAKSKTRAKRRAKAKSRRGESLPIRGETDLL